MTCGGAAAGRSITAASVPVLIVFLGLTGWMYLARVVRGEFLSLKEREYVQSALALGVGGGRIIWRHLLPNVATPVIVATVLNVAYNMLAEAGLDYLGFGIPPNIPTWGNMLTAASEHMSDLPLLVITPGLALLLVIVSLHLLGDGLRDFLDPHQRQAVLPGPEPGVPPCNQRRFRASSLASFRSRCRTLYAR